MVKVKPVIVELTCWLISRDCSVARRHSGQIAHRSFSVEGSIQLHSPRVIYVVKCKQRPRNKCALGLREEEFDWKHTPRTVA